MKIARSILGLSALLLSIAAFAQVAERPLPEASEKLDYRISYRGVLTAYLWKDLADMSLYGFADTEFFNGQSACRSALTVNTENYGFAEFSYPVRLRYDSLHACDLSAAYLVSDQDAGVEDIHNFYWLDWDEGQFHGYRKRRYLPVNPRKVGARFFWEKDEHAWETDGSEPLPAFLRDYPTLDNGMDWLIFDRSVEAETDAALDPLSLLAALRRHDYASQPEAQIAVVHKTRLGYYRLQKIGDETLRVGGELRELTRVRVRKEDRRPGSSGQLDVWLDKTAARTPWLLEIQAKIGLIRVLRQPPP